MTKAADDAFEQAARRVCDLLLTGNLRWDDEVLDNLGFSSRDATAAEGNPFLPWSVAKAALIQRAAELILEGCVIDARAIGISWSNIGYAMGKSGSTVHRWAAHRDIEARASEVRQSGAISDRVVRYLGDSIGL